MAMERKGAITIRRISCNYYPRVLLFSELTINILESVRLDKIFIEKQIRDFVIYLQYPLKARFEEILKLRTWGEFCFFQRQFWVQKSSFEDQAYSFEQCTIRWPRRALQVSHRARKHDEPIWISQLIVSRRQYLGTEWSLGSPLSSCNSWSAWPMSSTRSSNISCNGHPISKISFLSASSHLEQERCSLHSECSPKRISASIHLHF